MPVNPRSTQRNPNTLETMQNRSWDPLYDTHVVENLGFDGANLQRMAADALAIKITVSGNVTYLAIAAPGTAQATAGWQARAIDETSGTVITWADGDSNFDNVATDLTALTYS